jgi:hypothetical protein
MPSPGGQVSGMGACHPDDLPGGLPRGPSWAEPREVGCGVRRGLPTSVRAVGLRQVDGMALGTQPAQVEQWATTGHSRAIHGPLPGVNSGQ